VPNSFGVKAHSVTFCSNGSASMAMVRVVDKIFAAVEKQRHGSALHAEKPGRSDRFLNSRPRKANSGAPNLAMPHVGKPSQRSPDTDR